VVSTLYLTCGRCRYCLTGRETLCADFRGYVGIHTPGAYAKYTTVPAVNLVKLPAQVSFAEGSVIANAIGTPYHALTKRARLQPAERIIITGAGGRARAADCDRSLSVERSGEFARATAPPQDHRPGGGGAGIERVVAECLDLSLVAV
jgi:Zn-dependent alcohol dehydrogenase